MCYFRHYNKSSNWYPSVGLETFFDKLPHRQQFAARQTKLQSYAASFEDHRSPALWYIRCCTQLQILLSHCLKSMVSSFPAENKVINIADIRCFTGCSLWRSTIPLS